MKKNITGWIVLAVVLIVIGGGVFYMAMSGLGWKLNRLDSVPFKTEETVFDEELTGISVQTDTADLVFVPASDGKTKVVCFDREDMDYRVSVQNGNLTVAPEGKRNWTDQVGTFFSSPKITICLPEREYAFLEAETQTGDIEIPKDFSFSRIDISGHTGSVLCRADVTETLRIELTTGDIRLEDLCAGEIDLRTSTGDIFTEGIQCKAGLGILVTTGDVILTDTTAKNLNSEGSTGEMTLKSTVIAEEIRITRSTGSVNFQSCDAGEISVKTSTGDVEGSLQTEKRFLAQSNTGRVQVPNTASGGKCEITTSTGDIRITVGNDR